MNSPPENNSSNSQSLLVIGFGDLAERLQQPLSIKGWQVEGLCRSQKLSGFVQLHQGDAANQQDLEKVLATAPSQVLVTLTPDERTPGAYESAYVRTTESLVQSCKRLSIRPHIIFISSTAVYGQDDGADVDEESVAKSSRFNGLALRKAEQLLEDSRLPLTIIRFSGIYGCSARPLKERLRSTATGFSPGRWSNRIHVTDAVGVIEFVLQSYRTKAIPMGVLLASDQRPEQEGAIENWVRDQLQLPRIQFAGGQDSGKRCNSSRLQAVGYQLVVKDYRTGYLEGR